MTLLVLLVYFTLLRPDDPDGLRPIEAPGGGAQTNNNRHGNTGGPDHGGGAQRPTGSGGPAGPSGPAGGGGTTGTVLAGTGGVSTPGTTPVDGTNPSDDQYADAVGSLLRKVATGGAIGE